MKKFILLMIVGISTFMIYGCANSTEFSDVKQSEQIKILEEDVKSIEEYLKAIEEEVASIHDEILSEKMNDAQMETVSEDESEENISIYDSWIEAEYSSSEREMYETIMEGFVIVDDEIARGWLDEGTKQFIRLIKGNIISEDTSTGDYMNAYRSLDERIGNSDYCIRDFFCVDKYEDSVSTGIYNMLQTINQLEAEYFNGNDIVKTNENNNIIGWDFDVVGGDSVVAEAIGISEELIIIIQHAAADAGFTVYFND